MRVLITGASGFIGSEILSELTVAGFQVFSSGRRRKSSKLAETNKLNNFFLADITDYKSLEKIETLKRVDAVIHAAGLAHQFKEIARDKFTEVNVLGTKNILKLAKKLDAGQFILISSTAVYGIKESETVGKDYLPELEIDENASCEPETLYAKSKLEAEIAAREFCEKNKISLTILRLAPVIGEGNVGNVAQLIEIIDKKRFIWVGGGENFKTLIYKQDVALACKHILTVKRNKIEVFNLAAEAVNIQVFVNEIASLLGKKIPKIKISTKIPEFIFWINSRYIGIKKLQSLNQTVKKWLSNDVYTAKNIEKQYGFKPETNISQALEKQINWYKLHKKR